MAKAVADTTRAWQNQAGFLHDETRIQGIGQMHDDGTGGTASLGNFPIWIDQCGSTEWESCPTDLKRRRGRRVGEVVSEVGKFSIPLDTGFHVGTTLFEARTIADGRHDINTTHKSLSNPGSQ